MRAENAVKICNNVYIIIIININGCKFNYEEVKIMQLSEQELETLAKILEDRLLENWCTSSNDDRYDAIIDECGVIHSISRKLMLDLPDYIASRF